MTSRLSRILKTFTFRLALVYVGLFSLSVILLFAFMYSFAMNYVQEKVADNIRTEYSYLLNEYRENGGSGIEQRVNDRVADDDEGNKIYLLVNRDHEKLAGNLNEWPQEAVRDGSFEKEGSWVHFYIEGTRSTPSGIQVKALIVPLSKWRSLLIGQSMQDNAKIEQTIIQAFWASLLVTILMAFIGALIMTQSVIRRLSIINRSAATIMHGNLSARIPFNDGGDEFDDLSSNLNRMLDKIEMLLLSLSQFSGNIAHDLRSPLNRIINRLDAGLRSLDQQNPAYRLLEKNIKDMEGLVGTFNSILKISELEANTEFRQFEPCNLYSIITDLVEFYEPLAADKDISLRADIPQSLTIPGEKNLLTQAFANLIDNAIKFTPARGTITIAGTQNDEHITITVTDTGTGIPPEYRERVFEKFFRLEQSRNTKGNGLGLSLVAAIARIHNATITLEDNHPGLKVTLSFKLSA